MPEFWIPPFLKNLQEQSFLTETPRCPDAA